MKYLLMKRPRMLSDSSLFRGFIHGLTAFGPMVMIKFMIRRISDLLPGLEESIYNPFFRLQLACRPPDCSAAAAMFLPRLLGNLCLLYPITRMSVDFERGDGCLF